MTDHILSRLYSIMLSRKHATSETSYVASLYEKGTPKIGEKIIEEAEELIGEALLIDDTPDDKALQKNIRNEAADLLFHMMAMLAHHNVPISDVFDILEQRYGTSGHTEKASRQQ